MFACRANRVVDSRRHLCQVKNMFCSIAVIIDISGYNDAGRCLTSMFRSSLALCTESATCYYTAAALLPESSEQSHGRRRIMRLTITSAMALEMMLITVALLFGGATAQQPDWFGCSLGNGVRSQSLFLGHDSPSVCCCVIAVYTSPGIFSDQQF
jgi:hypothetical protein